MILSQKINPNVEGDRIDFLNTYPIQYANWGESCDVNASFSIGNDNKNIYLKYYVKEKNVLGRYLHINDPVFKDSCVEFFISFNNKQYYNFEFNCIGNVLAQYGANGKERTLLNQDLLQRLSIIPSLGNNKTRVINRYIQWTLDILIPIESFEFTKLNNLTGLIATGNFYKCGDDLPEPHYLSWSPVKSSKSDFHSPDSFMKLKFT